VSDDGFINTLLELNPGSRPGQALAAGLYTVSITAADPTGKAGERQFNERLVIQP